uniref:Uncharacterized protein n=1 Tax=Arion vulgaris TaxID=1028688 RepID=A0A0B7B118_9EUPU
MSDAIYAMEVTLWRQASEKLHCGLKIMKCLIMTLPTNNGSMKSSDQNIVNLTHFGIFSCICEIYIL